jgi:hypothetical protein
MGRCPARAASLRDPPAAEILALQRLDGSRLAGENAYTPMYKSTVWHVIFLAELAADGRDKLIQRAVEYVMDTMQHEDGSFPATWSTWYGNLIFLPCAGDQSFAASGLCGG